MLQHIHALPYVQDTIEIVKKLPSFKYICNSGRKLQFALQRLDSITKIVFENRHKLWTVRLNAVHGKKLSSLPEAIRFDELICDCSNPIQFATIIAIEAVKSLTLAVNLSLLSIVK